METIKKEIPNRILFLDVDGCLNYTLWYYDDRNPGNLHGEEDVDPLCVDRINLICEKTGAKVVVSSDWRIESNWKKRLEKAGVKNIIDKTPITVFEQYGPCHHFTRAEEIEMWLLWHPEVKNYVIIDDLDEFDDAEQLEHFVKVNSYRGLSDENVEEAIKILDK